MKWVLSSLRLKRKNCMNPKAHFCASTIIQFTTVWETNNWTRKDDRVEFFYNHWYKEVKKEAYVRNTGKETIKPREGVEFRASNHRLLIVLKPIRNCCLPIVCQLIWILIYSYQFNSLMHNCVAWRRIKLNFVLFKSLYSITLQIIDLFLWTGFVMILIKYLTL